MRMKLFYTVSKLGYETPIEDGLSVDGVGTGLRGVAGAFTVLVGLVGMVEALVAAEGIMHVLLAHLAGWFATGPPIAAVTLTTTMAITAAMTLPHHDHHHDSH